MEYNDKQIGRNIKAIRNANNKSYLDFATDIGISDSLLQKIENGGRHATDEIIQIISTKTGFPFNDIKYKDLSTLEKRELYFEEEMSMGEFVEAAEVSVFFVDMMKFQFPIVEPETNIENEEFSTGIHIVHEKIQPCVFLAKDCINAINHFIRASKISTYADLSAINILSCFGYLYVATVLIPESEYEIKKLSESKISSMSDYFGSVTSCIDQSKMAIRKRNYLNNYNRFLTTYMRELVESGKNSDFAYYFLCLRYNLGIMDENITLIDEHQMRLFGESMLDSLWKMGNKYAKALHDHIESL